MLAPDLGKQYQVKKFATKIILISLLIVLCPLEYCIDPDKEENKEKSFIRNSLFENYKKPTYELRRCLKRIAHQRSVSQAQVAINWCCYQGTIPLVGMRKNLKL